jgi:hypothetical protein
MNRSESEFWNSKLVKIMSVIDMYIDKKMLETKAMNNEPYQSKYFSPKETVKEVKSLKEIEGWGG